VTEAESIQAALRDMAKSIGGLESTVSTMTRQWRDQEDKASLGRRDLHQKIDAMRDELQKLDTRVTTAIDDIAEMKPTVQEVKDARQQAVGAGKASVWLWRFVMFVSGGVAWVVANYFNIKIGIK
jgi:predicted  nucleic acid-binding Zn-ribbon protein